MVTIKGMIKRVSAIGLFALYSLTVLSFTVLARPTAYHAAQFELFWSVREWIAGDWALGGQILANVAMLIPFGLLLCRAIHSFAPHARRLWLVTIVSGALFSLTIETLQMLLMRGLFECDDLISNTLGAYLGAVVYGLLKRWISPKRAAALWGTVSVMIAAFCLAAAFLQGDMRGEGDDVASQAFGFQIEQAVQAGDRITLTGYAMRYEHRTSRATVVLKDAKTGRQVRLSTDYGLSRPDVGALFSNDKVDYTPSGFTAFGTVDGSTEYEVLIGWEYSVPVPTGVYLTGDRVHYVPDEGLVLPDAGTSQLQEILNKGSLRVYRPDRHCWVYQDGTSLYWIVDQDFAFEEDGTTYIQYQLWTTQTDRLPSSRLENGHLWDNIGAYFEDYELKSDFGPYRVMKRELPAEYAVTCVLTGYYTQGAWVWKNFFRPTYDLMAG